MNMHTSLSYPMIRFIGLAEIAGAIGVIVPQLTGMLPMLTPLAAACFAIIMVMAIPIHYKRGEYKSVTLNIVLLLTSFFFNVYAISLLIINGRTVTKQSGRYTTSLHMLILFF